MNDKVLADTFLPFGEIAEVTIPKPDLPSSTEPHRGFGYIEFELSSDAKEAIDNMDQSELFGRVIKVAAAKPQKDSSEGLGSKTAVWQQASLINVVSAWNHILIPFQEGYLAKHAVSAEDRITIEHDDQVLDNIPNNPMQGLEGLDMAGPRPV